MVVLDSAVIVYPMLIAAIALLFFAVVPGLGALHVRRRWRSFRSRIVQTALYPAVGYDDFVRADDEGFVGYHRFIGSLEAIQGTDTVWVHDGTMSVRAELGQVVVHFLPSDPLEREEENRSGPGESLPDETPQHLPWSRVWTLPEGTRMLIGGALYVERGHAVFRSEREVPLSVVLFDGNDDTILKRSIWSGRQKNEYWNQFTLSSLLAGAVALFVLAYYVSPEPMLRPAALLALVAGACPVLPFLPPGIGLFFVYKHLWHLGRTRRGQRDLLALPVYRFNEPEDGSVAAQEVRLPDGESYVMEPTKNLDQAKRIASRARVRSAGCRAWERSGFSVVFGVRGDRGDTVTKPADPLAEHLIIPGNPWMLSRRCARSAKQLEIASLLCFAAGLAGNAFLVLFALASWIR